MDCGIPGGRVLSDEACQEQQRPLTHALGAHFRVLCLGFESSSLGGWFKSATPRYAHNRLDFGGLKHVRSRCVLPSRKQLKALAEIVGALQLCLVVFLVCLGINFYLTRRSHPERPLSHAHLLPRCGSWPLRRQTASGKTRPPLYPKTTRAFSPGHWAPEFYALDQV